MDSKRNSDKLAETRASITVQLKTSDVTTAINPQNQNIFVAKEPNKSIVLFFNFQEIDNDRNVQKKIFKKLQIFQKILFQTI